MLSQTNPDLSTEGWPSVRRYPRTLQEAFGGTERACAITCYRREARVLARACAWFAVGVALAILAFAIGGR
jgi:hypothetical protein